MSTELVVAIVIPPQAQPLDISGPLAVFREANRQFSGSEKYQVVLLSTETSTTVNVDGMTVKANASITDEQLTIDTLLVAGTDAYQQAFDMNHFQQWLQLRVRQVRRYGSVCTGAFFLAEAGLLDGRRATTHWEHADELASRYPQAEVFPDAIYIQDGSLYTSAGVTAGIDLALKLVEDDLGHELALKVAKRLVVFLKRPGGQSQFSAHLAAQASTEGRISRLQAWILDNLSADLSLSVLASKTAMSVRNFSRVFQREAGYTPADFVELSRVDAARRYLEDSDLSLQRIATLCGFSSSDVMRRTFLRRITIGPKEYRKQFQIVECEPKKNLKTKGLSAGILNQTPP